MGADASWRSEGAFASALPIRDALRVGLDTEAHWCLLEGKKMAVRNGRVMNEAQDMNECGLSAQKVMWNTDLN